MKRWYLPTDVCCSLIISFEFTWFYVQWRDLSEQILNYSFYELGFWTLWNLFYEFIEFLSSKSNNLS